MFDKELQLRDIADGAETSTAAETGISLPVRMAGKFKVVAEVTSLDVPDNETYSLDVLVADTVTNLSSSPVEIAGTPVTTTGRHEIAVTSEHVTLRDADSAAVTIRATIAGDNPEIIYGAWIEPL